jgi:hypothetical protein
LHYDTKVKDVFQQKQLILADSDFLGIIFEDKEILDEVVNLLGGKQISLYPLTEFEFLRDVFVSKQRTIKEEFISKDLFAHLPEDAHVKIFYKLLENALILSKIFAHQSQKAKQRNTSSFVDLMLAGLLMYLREKVVLVTGNKKDFPSCIFDLISVLNKEEQDGSIRSICVIVFNESGFNRCLAELP